MRSCSVTAPLTAALALCLLTAAMMTGSALDACEHAIFAALEQSISFSAHEAFTLIMKDDLQSKVALQSSIRVVSATHGKEHIQLDCLAQVSDVQLHDAVTVRTDKNEALVSMDGNVYKGDAPACILLDLTLQMPPMTRGLSIDSDSTEVLFDATSGYIETVDLQLGTSSLLFEHARGFHAGNLSASLKHGHIKLLESFLTVPHVSLHINNGALMMARSNIFGHDIAIETHQGAVMGTFAGSPDVNVLLSTTTGAIDALIEAPNPGPSHRHHRAHIVASSHAGDVTLDTRIATPIDLLAESKNGDVKVIIHGNVGGEYNLLSEHGAVTVEKTDNESLLLQRQVQGVFGEIMASMLQLTSVMGNLLLCIDEAKLPETPPSHEKSPVNDPSDLYMILLPLGIAIGLTVVACIATWLLKGNTSLTESIIRHARELAELWTRPRARGGREATAASHAERETNSERQHLLNTHTA